MKIITNRPQKCIFAFSSIAVFQLSQFLSENQRFVTSRANNFWQYDEHALEKMTNCGNMTFSIL